MDAAYRVEVLDVDPSYVDRILLALTHAAVANADASPGGEAYTTSGRGRDWKPAGDRRFVRGGSRHATGDVAVGGRSLCGEACLLGRANGGGSTGTTAQSHNHHRLD